MQNFSRWNYLSRQISGGLYVKSVLIGCSSRCSRKPTERPASGVRTSWSLNLQTNPRTNVGFIHKPPKKKLKQQHVWGVYGVDCSYRSWLKNKCSRMKLWGEAACGSSFQTCIPRCSTPIIIGRLQIPGLHLQQVFSRCGDLFYKCRHPSDAGRLVIRRYLFTVYKIYIKNLFQFYEIKSESAPQTNPAAKWRVFTLRLVGHGLKVTKTL